MKRLSLLLMVFFAFTSFTQAQLLKTEDLYEEWNGVQWEYTTNSIYSYNFNLNEEEVYSYTWDENQSFWDPFHRILYTYNANVQLIEQLNQSENGGWEDTGRYLYTYDGNGNLATSVHQFKSGNMWVNANKLEYTYDGNGNQIQAISQVWDSNNSLWVNSSKGVYTYNNGILTEELYESWDDQISMWLTDGKVLSTYDGSGLLVTKTSQLWENGGWRNQSKREYTYNNDGNLVKEEVSNWDTNNNAWILVGKIETIYNNDDLPYQETAQSWVTNAWQNVSRHTYTYDVPQSTEELGAERLNVYPNPASDMITINLDENTQSTAMIYSADGRIVASHVFAGKVNRVPLNQLPTGSYFLQLTQGGKVYSSSFVKE